MHNEKDLDCKVLSVYPESECSGTQRKEKGNNTLKACVPLLLDITQSNPMASRTAVILIG